MMKQCKQSWRHISWMAVAVMVVCLASCNDSKDNAAMSPFNPKKPVVVTDFSPKKAGMGARVLVYGTNFGDDISILEVAIGGKAAKIIGLVDGCIYCIMPAQAYDGDIKVNILNDNGDIIATSGYSTENVIEYEKKMLVTTLLGKMNPNGTYDVKDGPFEDCGGLGGCVWMVVDPKDRDIMYCVGESHPHRKIDLRNRMLTTLTSNFSNAKWAFLWSHGGDSLICVRHTDGVDADFMYYATRNAGFTDWTPFMRGNKCRSAALHPVNGEMYYNQTVEGKVLRYDWSGTGRGVDLFSVQESGESFVIVFHPTGNYAYFWIFNKHYVMRSDYDWVNKKLTTPYLVCGSRDNAGWVDGVGSAARLNGGLPSQGCFVKNQQYVDEGREDVYDFYFCERNNHDIRILTPDGKVTTFAGRGSNGTSGYNDGDLRLEARFKYPEAIVYDEEKKCFYIGDRENRCIRKIGYENDVQ